MYDYQTIKPRLIQYVGPRRAHAHKDLCDGIVQFIDNLSQHKIYGTLDPEGKDRLTGSLTDLLSCLKKEDTWISARRKNKTPALTESITQQPHSAQFEMLFDLLDCVAARAMPADYPRTVDRIRQRSHRKKMAKTLGILHGLADKLDSDYNTTLLQRTYLPENGPLDLRELIFTLQLYTKVLQSKRYEKMIGTNTKEVLFHSNLSLATETAFLVRELRHMANDIVLDTDKIDIAASDVNDYLDAANFRPEHIIALTRYYAEHHKERMTKIQHSSLERQLTRVYFQCFMLQTKRHSAQDMTLAYAAQRSRTSTWIELSRPTMEDTLKNIHERSEKSKPQTHAYNNFIRHREKIPQGMEEVLTLYYPENEDIRKARQAAFKSRYYGSREGAKRCFVRSLVACHADTLRRHYNAAAADIEHMRMKCSFPETMDITVEHITDRKFGGTNHEENLIAMPRWINERKEKMIQAQLAALGPLSRPTWIVTWHPKRDRFGNFPDIYIPEKTPSVQSRQAPAPCEPAPVPVLMAS